MSSAGTAYVDIEARTDTVADAIESALSSVDGTVDVVVETDVSEAESALDSLEAAPVEVPVDADVAPAESEIDGIEPTPVEVPVTADTEQAQASVDELSSSFQDLAGGLSSGGATGLLDGFASAAAGAGLASSAAASGGIALLGVGINDTVSSFGEAQAVAAETESMLDSMGAGAVTTADHISSLSQSIMEYSGFSDEAVQAGANTLLMFENINSQPVFDRALNDAADLARRLGTDVPSAARMLGIALQDPEAGMNRLRRAGVVLTESQKETITAMMETGNVAGAQEVIFDALEGKIGNLAEAYGDTLPGQIDKTNEAIDEHKEKIGAALAPAYESALSAIDKFLQGQDAFVSGLSNARSEVEDFLGISDEVKRVGPALGSAMDPAGDAFDDTAASAAALEDAISGLSSEIDDYIGGLFDVPDAQQALRQSFSDLAAAMDTGTWDDQADAMQGVVESTAEVIDAQNRSGASQEEMDTTIYAAIVGLHGLQDQGKLTAGQVQDLTDDILGIPRQSSTTYTTPGLGEAISNADKYAEKAKMIDKLAPSTPFSAPGLSDAYSKSVNYLGTLNAMDGKVITTTFRTIGSPTGKSLATGTESAAPGLTLVGEEGPELVVFGGGERVYNASQTAALASNLSPSAAAGTVINVNIHGSATKADGQAVVDALLRWQQRNGPVPVKVNG